MKFIVFYDLCLKKRLEDQLYMYIYLKKCWKFVFDDGLNFWYR